MSLTMRVLVTANLTGIATGYSYNGLGDLLGETSADRGATAYTYDSAGNLKTRTDARGVKHTWTYDTLNRPTKRTHTTVSGVPGTTQLIWTYDAGANGKGRLAGFSDETGSTAFAYDPHGRLTGKTQTAKLGTATLVHTLAQAYDTAGRLAQLTTPSGAQIATTYDPAGRPLELRLNGAVLLSDIVYRPFGPPKAWTWGNGTPYTRQIDPDGRISQYPVGSTTRSLVFDDASRITAFSHPANPALDHAYGYDLADRIDHETDHIGASLWTYDLNGNRLTAEPGTASYAYTYPGSSNRLQSVAGPVSKTYTYDAAGNPTSDGSTAFTFNAAGRLSKVVRSGQTNQYTHNAFGERVIKSGAYLVNGPYRFVYDEAGHLIGEYDKNNQPRQETVWLDDLPIAVLKKNPQGQTQAYYVHADHLNTPRAILDSQNRIVWKWNSNAFGQGVPEEDPDGDGSAFEYNPRYPGQYWDKETGLHYNYHRSTYDPMLGRYGEADPIGIEGGMNVYAYVGGQPIRLVDPSGLINLQVPGTSGETTVHANPGPGVVPPGARAEHYPSHVHLGSNNGPRVSMDTFEPLTPEDARRMSEKQKRFCKRLGDDIKQMIRSRQKNVFQYGRAMLAISALPIISLDSVTAACRQDPFFCAENMPYVFDDMMERICKQRGCDEK